MAGVDDAEVLSASLGLEFFILDEGADERTHCIPDVLD